ncbi:hypothetical protein ARC20_10600 [Stenotrophomonas panacihumi]|uniref:Lipoprotein n=1 Tax=Stenotrophomonas panacihumi TaxID=676599 RepID=A0A0R0APA3_9GAMM|nr:DUF6491 family protein [Stenotrophomonas panacihumi]KRG42855.1 hypothetical protein ARC20_10600 [Stenotrophomonas panacihumi]PTN55619.1 hypothetical protein C9J98_03285 [Stenotrophomonas panacihumi]
MRQVIALSVLAMLLAGCAHTATMTPDQRLALYQQHAGAPVPSLQLNRMVRRSDWTPLGDQAMALWSSPSRGHLLEFRTRCSGLSTAQGISITNQFGTVSARFDSVILRTPGTISPVSPGCRISRIRPLDGQALREAKREIREAQFTDRPQDVQPEPEEGGADTGGMP